MPAAHAAAASQSNPQAVSSTADIVIAWWEQDPEFHEYLDEMERQDYDRQA